VAANESIFERIAAGESGAVAECMDRYGALVWSLVRSRLSDSADAEDATQEIFIELWKNAGRFDPQVASEAVFVAMIARRRLIDRVRALGRQPVTEPIEPELPLFAVLEQRDKYANAADVALAARAVNELDGAQREIVLLGVMQGLSQAEIAAATGKPLGTVKTQLRRGLLEVGELIARRGVRSTGEGGE
jgi:RNA polymerase sigma-70 factor (ECF subfamily)